MFDRYNRRINYLRISVTDLCNLRCTYCMPATGRKQLRHEDILSFEEIEAITRTAVDLGITKVRLTGGEPLVRKGIISLVEMIGKIDGIEDYAMTTNGVLLPEFAEDLYRNGIRRLNISLDSLDPERFRETTRIGTLQDVLVGIAAAAAVPFDRIKLNCVIDESPDEPDARDVAAFGSKHGFEVRFIRRMETRRGQFWRVIGGDGGHCEICNRLRLSSDGKIYPCLFNDRQYSVRQLGPEQALKAAIAEKPESGCTSTNEFYAIGG